MNGRHTSSQVENTRKVLKHFAKTGEFLQPHAMGDITYLTAQIQSLTFHAPLPRLVPQALLSRLLGKRGMLVQYKENSERLCAIRKK